MAGVRNQGWIGGMLAESLGDGEGEAEGRGEGGRAPRRVVMAWVLPEPELEALSLAVGSGDWLRIESRAGLGIAGSAFVAALGSVASWGASPMVVSCS